MISKRVRIWYRWLPVGVVVLIFLVPAFVWSADKQLAPGADMPIILQVQRGTVKIDINMIPSVVDEMPVLKLTAVAAPEQYINRLLNKALPAIGRLEKNDKSPDLLVARHLDKVVAFTNVKNGHFEISPLLDQIKPTKLTKVQAVQLAQTVFNRVDIIPKDDTRFVTGPASPLYAATYVRKDRKGPGQEKAGSRGVYLFSVPAHRYVGKYAVFGPGSRAVVSVGDNQTIHGLTRLWKAGHVNSKVKPSQSPADIVAAIKAQLEPLTAGGNVTVNDVTVGYYDGNQDFIQPADRFTATIRKSPSPGTTNEQLRRAITSHVIGYVPIGKSIEPVPVLSATPKVMPKGEGIIPVPRAPVREDDPTVGRYVVRNDNPNWVANANEFWSGLTVFPWMATNFTNAQYYWAIPQQYTTNKNNRVNSVNVALTEGHGDWWLFTTLSNCCDVVDINTIPGGYGTSAGGNLRFWAIHSCEVVPAPDDTASWPNPWWNIFQGLHSVVGYRTIMYIDDDIGFPFGVNVGLGMPFVSSWLSTLHGASAYASNPATIVHGGHYPGDPCNYTGPNSILCKPMGRATAIAVCGHENDNVYNTQVLPPANCLTVFWYPD